MKPYYQDEWVTIYHGDCREILPELAAERNLCSLGILDPPYDEWGNLYEGVYAPLQLVVDDANLLVFTKQPFDIPLLDKIKDKVIHEFIWCFSNGGAWVSPHRPLVSFQKIYWCASNNHTYFNPRTGGGYSLHTHAFQRGTKVFGGYRESGRRFTPSVDGTWIRDCLYFDKPQKGNIAEKPEGLLFLLIRCFSKATDTILDPFLGSGTTAYCAKRLNRKCIGIEIEEKYCEIAANRCRQSVMTLNV